MTTHLTLRFVITAALLLLGLGYLWGYEARKRAGTLPGLILGLLMSLAMLFAGLTLLIALLRTLGSA